MCSAFGRFDDFVARDSESWKFLLWINRYVWAQGLLKIKLGQGLSSKSRWGESGALMGGVCVTEMAQNHRRHQRWHLVDRVAVDQCTASNTLSRIEPPNHQNGTLIWLFHFRKLHHCHHPRPWPFKDQKFSNMVYTKMDRSWWTACVGNLDALEFVIASITGSLANDVSRAVCSGCGDGNCVEAA